MNLNKKNKLISYSLLSWYKFDKKNIFSKKNFSVIFLWFSIAFYFLFLIIINFFVKANQIQNNLKFNFEQLIFLVLTLVATIILSFDIQIIKKIVKNNETIFYFSINISKKEIFFARYFSLIFKILLFSLPINIFGFVIAENKLKIFLIYVCNYIFIIFLINIRLILINYINSNTDVRYFELVLSIFIYSMSFIFLPTDILKENIYWMKYFQYFSPTGWIMLIILNLNKSMFMEPFIYLFIFILLINFLTFWKAKTLTWF